MRSPALLRLAARRAALKAAAWTALALSADGARLVASDGNYAWASGDGGQTWENPKLNGHYRVVGHAVALSADGLRLAAAQRGYAWLSADGGATWSRDEAPCLGGPSAFTPALDSAGLTMSSDGGRLATAYLSALCTSADGGLTWARELNDAPRNWTSLAASTDGERLLAAEQDGYLWVKAGGAWTAVMRVGKLAWRSVASSADGRTLFAAAAGGVWATPPTVFRSSDGGATWLPTQVTTAPAAEPQRTKLAASSDGTRLALIVSTETAGQAHLYTSADGGASWSRQAGVGARSYRTLAMSPDGLRLAAGVDKDIIYLSADGGTTWQ